MDQSVALNRFGLGARRGQELPGDPKAWLLKQIDAFDPRPDVIGTAPTRTDVAEAQQGFITGSRARAVATKRAQQSPPADPREEAGGDTQGTGSGSMQRTAGDPSALVEARKADRQIYIDHVEARTTTALTTSTPFMERMVHFWANHFAISIDKRFVRGMAGAMEFEAIRPNITRKFGDMLLAVEQHPAMLLYLDQQVSVGPNSAASSKRPGGKPLGYNENLAREIMELHTLGVRSGYTQADVIAFALSLTGWTVDGLLMGPVTRLIGPSQNKLGEFIFADAIHEPGARTILGKSYPDTGVDQGKAILADLATNRATAVFTMTKLARHFVADSPPQSLVDRLVGTFNSTGGDLPSIYRTLVGSPESWGPATKFKTPWDWALSSWRATGATRVPGAQVVNLLRQLGEPIWQPGSPAGFDDTTARWASSDALIRRVEAAERMTGDLKDIPNPNALLTQLLPGAASSDTVQAIARAESPGQAMAMLLVAPEFMRR